MRRLLVSTRCMTCRLFAAAVVVAWSLMTDTAVRAAVLDIDTGLARLSAPVASYMELRFRTTIKQKYDFSCGSAALATLLTYHYESPMTEDQVFTAMYEQGDKATIHKAGFSLLDMKRYLESSGYKSDGFRFDLNALKEIGVPAITLVNEDGYRHFVVVKGVGKQHVLVGDPAKGTRLVSRADFLAQWNGIMFVVSNKRSIGARHFNSARDLEAVALVSPDWAVGRTDIASTLLYLPSPHMPISSRIQF